ncbi:hypothetical protein [Acetobacterium sp.]|uniref:hypothetical protein n=1 Tax=Acetobacterium sp. TaxID=1872094 RepID=UPI002F42DF62
MKSEKQLLLIQAGSILVYILYFILMKNLFDSHKNDLFTMAETTLSSYKIYSITLYSITFFQWFFLGVLLSFLSFKNRPGFHFSVWPLLIAFAWLAISIMGSFPFYGPFMVYQSEYKELFLYVAPIFSGFYLFKSLFNELLNREVL